jgi:phosphoribosylaminoimidazolecarboxamide formyltransferase / IMP cyclohydrolase
VSGRIAVCVSGEGSNLRALRRHEKRGALGGSIVLVLADRPCAALGFAVDEGIPTALVTPDVHPDRGAWDAALAQALHVAKPDWIVLAGFMRLLGKQTLAAYAGRILNVHPSLLPAFAGAQPVADTLRGGARVSGVAVHFVDATLDGGPIVAQEAVPVLPTDDEASLHARLHAVEHRLLPHVVALALAGGVRLEEGRAVVDDERAAALPRPRRALLSVSDKAGLLPFARELDRLGFELVSTGGTARALRADDLPVTDVADVTGFPEMLDGRVKTLHPRIEAGVLADLRRNEHRAQLAALAIAPFELVVVNLYPFMQAAVRTSTTLDELIEEIDIGGPTLVRAAAKNHASVGVVTEPAQYDAVLAELGPGKELSEELRRELAAAAFRLTASYDTHIAEQLAARWWPSPSNGATDDGLPQSVNLRLRRLQGLRYGENPHQSAAMYGVAGVALADGPFADGANLLQGKPLSYNNILDASAAAALARDLRGHGCVIVKHANPCGVAETRDPLTAWAQALAGDPLSAFGGVVALTSPIGRDLAERLTEIFLEVIVAPACEPDALEVLSRKKNLRVLLDAGLGRPATAGYELRSAGGALLLADADVEPDDPGSWRVATQRSPTASERTALNLAWRVSRHVKSNAIVLVRDGAVVGVGAGQMSRVDSARLAVAKAGPQRAAGAVCASDAFYPFPDALEVCAAAGVTAFIQPGGSQRDAEVTAAADAVGAAMLFTGVRHFRH